MTGTLCLIIDFVCFYNYDTMKRISKSWCTVFESNNLKTFVETKVKTCNFRQAIFFFSCCIIPIFSEYFFSSRLVIKRYLILLLFYLFSRECILFPRNVYHRYASVTFFNRYRRFFHAVSLTNYFHCWFCQSSAVICTILLVLNYVALSLSIFNIIMCIYNLRHVMGITFSV